ncbi:VOC family protein [Streptomyces lusitanus]|uniref:VOC family protein n=1 Tax=Streptomyces lusitanus TaxID=68232 RepID=A0ABU3JV04_9ACTN|nr:VOC family protein [Streptomyces lusitanus]
MTLRAFPLLTSADVEAAAEFYALLGFVRHHRHPAEGTVSFVTLRRGATELAISAEAADASPDASGASRWRMFVFVEDVDATVERLAARGVAVLSPPADMPWGERVALVADPEHNPVALASTPHT